MWSARVDSLEGGRVRRTFLAHEGEGRSLRYSEVTRLWTSSEKSEYTTVAQTDPIEQYASFDHGLELSRRFRGLKVWSILKARGRRRLAEAIQHDVNMRKHLDARVEHSPRLEALGSELSIACFRYLSADPRDPEHLNRLNRTILETLVAEGRCYMSPTELDGRYALRACIVNFRTTAADVDFLLDEVERVGDELDARP